jgi:hypothetical protein
MPVQTRIQHRRDSEANWAGVTLAAGEIGYVTSGSNAGNFKIGDGTTVWSGLPFIQTGDTQYTAGNGIAISIENVISANFGTTSTTVLAGNHAGTSSGVHGVTGSLVGTTDVQSLSNKTLLTVKDRVNVVAAATSGTINVDVNTANVWFYTNNSTANFTLNFRGSSSETLNNKLAVGEAITVTFINTNGSTAYYPTTFQIDGTTLTGGTAIRWQLGFPPAAGDASSLNTYTFTIIKTAATPAYTVLGSQSKFLS